MAGLVALVALVVPGTVRAAAHGQGGGCIAHRPAYVEDVFESHYTAGCSGHDEPELDPVSAVPGSAKDITWTAVLPSNGSFFPVDAVGPTFWFGGTVNDPNSLFGQAFEELQFYPNALVSNCTPNGGFVVSNAPGDYTVCSPVWTIHTTGQKPNFHEPAAFNAMLTTGSSGAPLVMHAGDTIQVHYFVTAAKDGWHINVQDLTTGQSGTIVLDSKSDGPLMPAYNTQKIGSSLKWGVVHDTPDSFVWEIGHTSPFTSPHAQFCAPGAAGCYSYDAPAWRDQSPPIHILGVTLAGTGLHRLPVGAEVVDPVTQFAVGVAEEHVEGRVDVGVRIDHAKALSHPGLLGRSLHGLCSRSRPGKISAPSLPVAIPGTPSGARASAEDMNRDGKKFPTLRGY